MKRQLTLFNTFAPLEKNYKQEKNNYEKFVNKYFTEHREDGTKEKVKEQADKLWKEVSYLLFLLRCTF